MNDADRPCNNIHECGDECHPLWWPCQTSKTIIQKPPSPANHVVDVCCCEHAVINSTRVHLSAASSATSLPPPFPLLPLHAYNATASTARLLCTSVLVCFARQYLRAIITQLVYYRPTVHFISRPSFSQPTWFLMDFTTINSVALQPQKNAVNAHISHMTLNNVCTLGVFITALLSCMSGSHMPVTTVASQAAVQTFSPVLLVSSSTQTWRHQLITIRPCDWSLSVPSGDPTALCGPPAVPPLPSNVM